MALPTNVGTGRIVGVFIDNAGDAIGGTFTFTATPSSLKNTAATPQVTILPKPVPVTLDGTGSLSVDLIATDDAGNNPVGWNYLVTFEGGAVEIDPFYVEVPAGSVQDLAAIAPVAEANGVPIVRGASAYEVAVDNGFVGTEQEWLDSLGGSGTGTGSDGADGASAYEIAVVNGFVGTEVEWLASLEGPEGPAGADGTDGTNGTDGADGASAYEVAVAAGFVGTEAEWLASLEGPAGADGTDGTNGADGADGLSAYEVAVQQGFVGTEAEWLASLEGPEGPAGTATLVNQSVSLDPTTEFVAEVDVVSDASPTGSWPDRFAFYFTPDGGSRTRTGYHNEYGELRARPAKDNTVALRAMSHSTDGSGPATGIFQVASGDGSVIFFEVRNDGITTLVPIDAPNIGVKIEDVLDAAETPPGGTPAGTIFLIRGA